MKIMYDVNLSRIYELVINSDPCYAFLLEGNSLIQNKLVIAHVFAHGDFFKNNAWFRRTNRGMVESMAVHAQRIREYEFQYGRGEVEKLLDAALAVQEHIDPCCLMKKRTGKKPEEKKPSPYEDIWSIGEEKEEEPKEEEKKFPLFPEKDLLEFIIRHSHVLKDWQKDILDMVHQEMFYLWPQIETKIMNEGWATFWHARIMRELDLSDEETLEFARLHSGIIQPSRMQLNPYLLGVEIFEDIAKRWGDQPFSKGQGIAKIFEVREMENDISFIRNYLTKDLVRELDLYLYKKQGQQWKVVDTDWETVREGIIAKLINGGFPYLVVEDGDYEKNGHLYIKHQHEGVDMDTYYLEKTLPYVFYLWGKPVHLETVLEGRPIVFNFDGNKTQRKGL
jgi:stage V sporulation protein R